MPTRKSAPAARQKEGPRPVHLVVGIGASAGGLEAFRTFFSLAPADSGMSFVIVQHLDPDHASTLVEILKRSTAMEVLTAVDGARLAPDSVHIIPPDSILTLEKGVLRVARPAAAGARRVSIDTFLTSLAGDQGDKAVGIILSGFGSDGARGIEAIKAHGGLTLAQADFDHHPKAGMPQSAASGGYVDRVLAVEQMPQALAEYARYRKRTDAAKGADGVRPDVHEQLGAICAVLNNRLGRDFSQYKASTLRRRVQRRMHVLQVVDVEAYIERLRDEPLEAERLFREVLISVTRFFRDPAAFEALAERRIATLLAAGAPSEPVRVWVAGCATGEEAYSIAILFCEVMASLGSIRKVQIFATDIDDRAIEHARAGLYAGTIAVDVSPSRLEQYFTREHDNYRVSKAIRAMCLFSVHDLVKDPPFSKLALVACRNVLIYFGPALQARAVAMFHYGLLPDGVLFLGSSEAIAAHAGYFAVIEKKFRLFDRVSGPTQPMQLAPGRSAKSVVAQSAGGGDELGPIVARAMSRFAPAFVIADGRLEVLRFSGAVAKFLEPTTGAASLNLASLIHTSLRAPLRAAIKQVAATRSRVALEDLAFEVAGRREQVNLIVEPLDKSGTSGGRLLIIFQDLSANAAAPRVEGGAEGDVAAFAELAATRERLQLLTEELEGANEELQSTNEEYQSVNEELQSTNEELETSKEELQSLNEELHTVNAELNDRNESLVDTNSDLKNLIDSTSIATLFLDDQLRIRRFTPPVQDLFNVRPGDEGRPITDIVSNLARDSLQNDVREAIRTLAPLSREVSLTTGDETYQMHIRPYRDSEDVISGAVVTFVDVTERKHHEAARARLAAIVEGSEDAIISYDLDGRILSWNRGAAMIYGHAGEEAIGAPLSMLFPEGRADEGVVLLNRLRAGETIASFDAVHRVKGGGSIDVSLTVSPIKDAAGEIVGASAVARDIAERKRSEREAALLLGELDHRVKNVLAVVSAVIGQTLRSAGSLRDFAATIEGRIAAIARAHGLLTETGKLGSSLDMIVRTELAPYGGGVERVTISGQDVILTPRAGMMIAMAIHELTTNAAKFGALSVEAGRLTVGWQALDGPEQPRLRIDWLESNGPLVSPPTRQGFGTTILERALAADIHARVKRDFLPTGLVCRIDVPISEATGAGSAEGSDRVAAP